MHELPICVCYSRGLLLCSHWSSTIHSGKWTRHLLLSRGWHLQRSSILLPIRVHTSPRAWPLRPPSLYWYSIVCFRTFWPIQKKRKIEVHEILEVARVYCWVVELYVISISLWKTACISAAVISAWPPAILAEAGTKRKLGMSKKKMSCTCMRKLLFLCFKSCIWRRGIITL